MIEAHIVDTKGVYQRTEIVDELGPQPSGAIYTPLPEPIPGRSFVWIENTWQQIPTDDLPREAFFSVQTVLPEFPKFIGNQKLDLFTQGEQLSVVTATMTDPVVKLIYDRMIGAAYMSYEDPETGQGLALLEVKGLLTAERKAEIVAAMQPVQ